MKQAQLFDRFVGLSSSRLLLQRLEETLEDIGTPVGRLYLLDSSSMTFYPVAAFACRDSEEELAFDDVLVDPRPGQHVLYSGGDPVGILEISVEQRAGSMNEGESDESPENLHVLMANLLGPVLVGVQRAEATLSELRQTHEQVSHLVTAGRLLRHLEVDVLLVEIIQTVISSVEAQVAAVVTADRDEGHLVIRTTWGLREDHVDAMCLTDGRRVCDAVFESGKVLRIDGDEVAEQLDLSRTDAQITGILALPLSVGDRRLGVLILANPEKTFTGDSERLAQTVCDMAAIALDNAQLIQAKLERERLGREMDLARDVQAQMTPPATLEVGAIQVAGGNRAADETGGDYYTYMERAGKLTALIGDVTGHGLGAALFTTAAHAIIQQQLASGSHIIPAMTTLNEGLYLTRSGRFMTAALIEIDPVTLQATYFSSGHNPLLWIHEGEVVWLESHGVPLGIMQGMLDTEGSEIQFTKGDTLLLYTDGFTEAFNRAGECSGEEAFVEWVQDGLTECFGPDELVQYLYRRTDEWMEGTPQKDDLTLVVLQM